MATSQSFIICFVLHVLACSSRGLELSMVRTPGQSICGQLLCWNNATIDGTIFTTTAITIYDVTNPDTKIKIANISTIGAGLFIDPTRSTGITGSGSLSRYHADIALDFTNDTDCRYGSFECELQFVNLAGLIDTARQTAAPEKNGCNCALLAAQLSQLASRFDGLDQELSRLKLNQTFLETEIASLKQQNAILEAKFENLTSGVSGNQNAQISTAAVPVVTNTPSSQLQGSCVRGQSLSPRVKFLLWGKVEALCDTVTDGGGWVIIQRRTKGDIDFYKDWNTYKQGFGTPDTDFWIGNDIIHNLTAEGYNELRIDMELDGHQYFAHYNIFNVDNELLNYKLTVSGYRGSAGDSMAYHNGLLFSTLDRDHDKSYFESCAVHHTSAWWYDNCYNANLNGVWGKNDEGGVIWMGINRYKSLTFTEMKVRHT